MIQRLTRNVFYNKVKVYREAYCNARGNGSVTLFEIEKEKIKNKEKSRDF